MSESIDTTAPEAATSAPGSSDIVSQSEIERLLAQVESADSSSGQAANPQAPQATTGHDLVRRHEFPNLTCFTATEMRRLRLRHEDFIGLLAAQLSIHLGLEVGVQMSKMEAMPFQKFVDGLSNPAYLTLLRLQPLPEICLLDIPPRLGLCMVDRELGGPGRPQDESRQIGKIEARLLSRLVDLIVQQWCGIWNDLLEIRPTVLGTETNSRFVATSAPAAIMLVVGAEVRLGETVESIQFAFPQPMLEPLTVKLNAASIGGPKPDAAAKTAPPKWSPHFDDLRILVRAELPEMQLPAGEVAALKPGDVLTLSPDCMSQVRLRLANHPGFIGNLGLTDQRRAVKIEKPCPD
jgi:flagellar motor switch protein FliM